MKAINSTGTILKLIIAEKPSVTKSIASSPGVKSGDDVLSGRIAEYERETGYDPKQDTSLQ